MTEHYVGKDEEFVTHLDKPSYASITPQTKDEKLITVLRQLERRLKRVMAQLEARRVGSFGDRDQ